MELTVEVRHEAASYWTRIHELPGCFASGRTLDELREALGEAIGLYLWDRPASIGEQDLHVGEVQIVVVEADPA
jgi:predicted RNase H-like HicB family nuclease